MLWSGEWLCWDEKELSKSQRWLSQSRNKSILNCLMIERQPFYIQASRIIDKINHWLDVLSIPWAEKVWEWESWNESNGNGNLWRRNKIKELLLSIYYDTISQTLKIFDYLHNAGACKLEYLEKKVSIYPRKVLVHVWYPLLHLGLGGLKS